MAAVIDLHTGASLPQRPHRAHPARPQLRLIEGGRSPDALRQRRVFLRRRLLVLGVVLLVVVGAGAMWQRGSSSWSGPGAVTVPHTVERGDTLWGLASAIDPDADPRDVIATIVRINAAGDEAGQSFSPDAPLRIGQQLLLPAAPA